LKNWLWYVIPNIIKSLTYSSPSPSNHSNDRNFGYYKAGVFIDQISNKEGGGFVIVLGSIVFIVLATGPKVRGFKPGRMGWVFESDKKCA
jgi:hypothetical protein